MGMLGTFLRGAVAGVIGLSVVSWLVSACCADEKADEFESDEPEFEED